MNMMKLSTVFLKRAEHTSFSRGISEKNSAEDGSICYIIGITKAIRAKINKGDGDQVHVIIKERE